MGPEEFSATDELRAPSNDSSNEAEEAEETPLADELRPWLKWLNDAKLDGSCDDSA